MSYAMRSVTAAVKRAAEDATDVAPSMVIGTVTAWATPRATVSVGGTSIPKIRATEQAAASISVDSRVVIMIHGSIAVIVGTI